MARVPFTCYMSASNMKKQALQCPSSRSESWAFPTGILRKQILIIRTRLGRNPLFTLKQEYGTQKRTYGKWYSDEKKAKLSSNVSTMFSNIFHNFCWVWVDWHKGLEAVLLEGKVWSAVKSSIISQRLGDRSWLPHASKSSTQKLPAATPTTDLKIWKMVKPC